jgi:hypothetical protein
VADEEQKEVKGDEERGQLLNNKLNRKERREVEINTALEWN